MTDLKALAERLRDISVLCLRPTSEPAGTIRQAADLIAKMAERKPFVWYDDDTGETYTPGAISDGGCQEGLRPLYTAPPEQRDDTALLRKALEALTDVWRKDEWRKVMPAISALRARLDGQPVTVADELEDKQ